MSSTDTFYTLLFYVVGRRAIRLLQLPRACYHGNNHHRDTTALHHHDILTLYLNIILITLHDMRVLALVQTLFGNRLYPDESHSQGDLGKIHTMGNPLSHITSI